MKRFLYLLALLAVIAGLSEPPRVAEAEDGCSATSCRTSLVGQTGCDISCTGCSSPITGGSGKCFAGFP